MKYLNLLGTLSVCGAAWCSGTVPCFILKDFTHEYLTEVKISPPKISQHMYFSFLIGYFIFLLM